MIDLSPPVRRSVLRLLLSIAFQNFGFIPVMKMQVAALLSDVKKSRRWDLRFFKRALVSTVSGKEDNFTASMQKGCTSE